MAALFGSMMTPGAIIARLEWVTENDTTNPVEEYAVVQAGAQPEDTTAIFTTLVSWYRTVALPTTGGADCIPGPSADFYNGFGGHAAHYDCNAVCVEGDPDACGTTNMNCWDQGLGCNAHCQATEKCYGGNCIASCYMMGTCGFPAVEFNAEVEGGGSIGFKTNSAWGWTYFDTQGTASCPCDCDSEEPISKQQRNTNQSLGVEND